MKSVKLNLFFLGIFILFAVHSFAQVQVSGTVIDNTGDSLPGVSILVKGTSRGGVTDLDGRYNLKSPKEKAYIKNYNVNKNAHVEVVSNLSVTNIMITLN